MQQFASQHPALYIVAITAFFLLVSMVAIQGVALTGGWRSLAERYRTERELPEHRRSIQRAQMRWATNYNNILTLGSDAEGLYMAMPSLLRFSHPTLFIPWSDIQVEEPRRWLFLMTQRLRLGPDRIPLRLREPLAQFLLEPRGGVTEGASGVKWGI
ncbi:MAG TPA: hypothetical protein VG714_10280 [Acidobacteriaceae bacterium]|nr:hypothetical protein [Acidobacteriaceae bacterium]